MIFRRLGFINKNQGGYTLVEVLVAVAITGIIVGGIAATIFQVITIEARTSNHMTAVRQVQNAGYWISHDTQMAQSVVIGDDAGTTETEVLNLGWVGWEYDCGNKDRCINTHEVLYTYDDDNDKIWRHQKITTEKYDSDGHLLETIYSPGPSEDDWETIRIAEYITSISIPPMVDNKLNVTITALVVEAEEVRTYEITPRPST